MPVLWNLGSPSSRCSPCRESIGEPMTIRRVVRVEILKRPFLCLNRAVSDTMTRLCNGLTGGPAIRVKFRWK